MIEAVDSEARFIEAQKLVAEARVALVAELVSLKKNRKEANAGWATEEKRIKELLRVKAPYTRKPKLEAAPEAEAKKKSA